MTKEELWKEAIKRVDAFIDNLSQDIRSTLYDRLNQEDVKDFLYGLYFDSAEPREKQIEIDAKQIRALQKQNGELTDKVKELEEKLANADYQLEGRDNEIRELKEQIEKMKSDVMANIKWADANKNNQMYFKLNAMFNQWEIKENDRRRIF